MTKIGNRDDYRKILNGRKIIGKDGCPFCDIEAQKDMILWRGKHWFIIQNKFPYTGTAEHVMAVPYEHHIYASEFSSEIWSEMELVHAWIRDFYGETGYFSFTRETLHGGGKDTRSIEHYHQHFCPGRLQGKYLRKMLQEQGFPVEEDLSC